MRTSPSLPACRPYTQPYDRAELIADAIMHATGLGFAVAALILLISAGDGLPGFQTASVWIYGIGLVTMFGVSAAYNIWPVCSAKLMLRRLHAFVLGAAAFQFFAVFNSVSAAAAAIG